MRFLHPQDKNIKCRGPASFLFLWENFLFVGFKPAFHFLYIFCRRQRFWSDATVKKHIADCTIIVDVFEFNAGLAVQIFLLYVYRGHFGGKILGFYCYCGKEVGKRPFFGCPDAAFHHGCIKTEQCAVSFCPDKSEALGINAPFIKHSRKSMLGFCEFGACLNPFIIKEPLMYYLCSACLNREVVLGKGDLRFAGIAVLRYKITGIARQHDVIYLTLSPRAEGDHFADIRKMVCRRFSCI